MYKIFGFYANPIHHIGMQPHHPSFFTILVNLFREGYQGICLTDLEVLEFGADGQKQPSHTQITQH